MIFGVVYFPVSANMIFGGGVMPSDFMICTFANPLMSYASQKQILCSFCTTKQMENCIYQQKLVDKWMKSFR